MNQKPMTNSRNTSYLGGGNDGCATPSHVDIIQLGLGAGQPGRIHQRERLNPNLGAGQRELNLGGQHTHVDVTVLLQAGPHLHRWNSWTSIWEKTRGFCSTTIHRVSTDGFLKENQTILYGFKNTSKKNLRNEKYHFVERKNEGRKLDKNSSLRRREFMPRNLEKKCVQEFHPWWRACHTTCSRRMALIRASARWLCRSVWIISWRKSAMLSLYEYRVNVIYVLKEVLRRENQWLKVYQVDEWQQKSISASGISSRIRPYTNTRLNVIFRYPDWVQLTHFVHRAKKVFGMWAWIFCWVFCATGIFRQCNGKVFEHR